MHYGFPTGVPDAIDVYTMRVPVGSFVLPSFSLPAGVRCSVTGPGNGNLACKSVVSQLPTL